MGVSLSSDGLPEPQPGALSGRVFVAPTRMRSGATPWGYERGLNGGGVRQGLREDRRQVAATAQ
jgi:hypothetical protein